MSLEAVSVGGSPARAWARVFAPWWAGGLAAAGVALLWSLDLLRPLQAGLLAATLLAGSGALFVLRHRRLPFDEACEAWFNRHALRRLRQTRHRLPLHPGERVLETFVLQRRTARWVILSSDRLLVLDLCGRPRLQAQWRWHELSGVSTRPSGRRRRRVPDWAKGLAGWIELASCDGQWLYGAARAPTVLRRVAKRLHAGGIVGRQAPPDWPPTVPMLLSRTRRTQTPPDPGIRAHADVQPCTTDSQDRAVASVASPATPPSCPARPSCSSALPTTAPTSDACSPATH